MRGTGGCLYKKSIVITIKTAPNVNGIFSPSAKRKPADKKPAISPVLQEILNIVRDLMRFGLSSPWENHDCRVGQNIAIDALPRA